MYEVYVCKLGDEVLYVGQGRCGRHKHCNSGASHVYELNKLHFSGIEVIVDVVYVDSRKDVVLEKERKMIYELQPKFNIVGNVVVKQGTSDIKQLKKHLETKDAKLYYKNVGAIARGYDDFKFVYKSADFSKLFEYENHRVYATRKLFGMEGLSRNYSRPKSSYGEYFLNCVNDIFYVKNP